MKFIVQDSGWFVTDLFLQKSLQSENTSKVSDNKGRLIFLPLQSTQGFWAGFRLRLSLISRSSPVMFGSESSWRSGALETKTCRFWISWHLVWHLLCNPTAHKHSLREKEWNDAYEGSAYINITSYSSNWGTSNWKCAEDYARVGKHIQYLIRINRFSESKMISFKLSKDSLK